MTRRSQRKAIALVIFTCIFLYYIVDTLKLPFSISPLSWIVRDKPVRCNKTRAHIKGLIDLTREAHNTLEELGIQNWLMYGSLWGIVRHINEPLPWDYDADIGIRGDDPNYVKISRKDFLGAFTKRGFVYQERLDRSGIIGFSNKNISTTAMMDVFVFYEYSGMMKRTGWATWLAPIRYNLHESFPASAIEFPLPKARFGNFDINVPRDIMLVLRHVYPYNWWKVSKPWNCID